MQVKPKITGKDLGYLAPTKEKQATFVTTIFGGAVVSRFPVAIAKTGIRIYKHGLLPAMMLAPARGAIRSDKKVGFRFGWDKTTPLGLLPIVGAYEPTLRKLPIPIPGFGLTAVPNAEARVFHDPRNKSRGGEDATSTGTPRSTRTATNTIVGPLTQGRGYPGSPGEETPRPARKGGGRPSSGNRRRRLYLEPVTPYCWRHKRRHYCQYV